MKRMLCLFLAVSLMAASAGCSTGSGMNGEDEDTPGINDEITDASGSDSEGPNNEIQDVTDPNGGTLGSKNKAI
jgi:hypothetical protein